MGRSRIALVGSALALACVLVVPLGPGADAAEATTRDPVVIVAGTFVDQGLADVGYAALAARLRAEGYEVSIFGLPGNGLGPIEDTAAALAQHVEGLRASTGAARVDLIGHSQGGLVARYYIEYLGGVGEVDSNIGLGVPNNGGVVANLLGLFGPLCFDACHQMMIGSSFLAELNAGDDSVGDVRYTNIATVYDEFVVPYTSAFMSPADGNVVNVTVQSQCWLRFVGHLGLALDGAVFSGVVDALEHRRVTLNCFAL